MTVVFPACIRLVEHMDKSAQNRFPNITHGDRFSQMHLYVWLAFGALIYCSDQLDRWLNLSYFLIPVILLPAVVVAITWLVGFAWNLWNRRWRSLVSVALAPVVTVAIFGSLLRLRIDPGWIHFQLTRATYLRLVHESEGASPKHLHWDWGDTGAATGPNIFHTLVFDEADKPPSGHPPADEQGSSISVRPMGDHFFLVTEVF